MIRFVLSFLALSVTANAGVKKESWNALEGTVPQEEKTFLTFCRPSLEAHFDIFRDVVKKKIPQDADVRIVVGEVHDIYLQKYFKNWMLSYLEAKYGFKKFLVELNKTECDELANDQNNVSFISQHIQFARKQGMEVVPIDSDTKNSKQFAESDAKGKTEAIFDPIREQDILENIKRQTGNQIVFLGHYHPSFLYNNLNDQHTCYFHLAKKYAQEKNNSALSLFNQLECNENVITRYKQYMDYCEQTEVVELPIQIKLSEENLEQIMSFVFHKFLSLEYDIDLDE